VLSDPTTDDVRQFGEKLLPKLCRMLTTQQAVFEFVQNVIVCIPAADGRMTDGGFEVLKQTPKSTAGSLPQHSATSTPPSSKIPQRSSLVLQL
jgi:hypothetical protein